MTRTIHLAIFSNGPRPAHYSLFIPTGNAGPKGKIIHVTGNIALGFHHQFKRNYDFGDEERKYILLPLAEVDERYIRDSPVESPPSEDATARDRLESEALPVRPPGPNPRPFDPLVWFWYLHAR